MSIGAVTVNLTDDDADHQALQVEGLADETLADLPYLQLYGFAHRPFPGAQGVLAAAGGAREQGIIIAVGDRRYRLKGLADGEVALYDDQGQSIQLKRDGIEISTELKVTLTAGGDVNLTAPKVTIDSPDVHLGGTGGQPVARVGDTVVAGVITSGSTKVRAA